ncbi:MAG: SDR family oxidoreductase [Peptococcaceae bacterium]|jgi:NAD(P)-dependent dehydrogenase (short-subunit alcohol dehydrogenase family)|nr:SDR family oxidoreductase [Peptococcaceae bacterium]MDH7524161.1 SDR family oxidoreductase [Peptococcaceae bacterium]
MRRVEGKVALITGAGSGIGETTAKLFASEGAVVGLVARRENTLLRVKEEIEAEGGKAFYIVADVGTLEGCEKAVSSTVNEYGRIDILVNNAGITDQNRSTVNTTDEIWEKVIAVNQTGVFYMCRAALRYMEKQGAGVIVNVSSIAGVYGNSGAAYSASKAAVISLTKNIAIQYAGSGIRCNAVCPGRTPTAFNSPEALEHFDKGMMEITRRHYDFSLPKTEPIDQAKAILFFACDESKAVTGQYLVIDNGMCL